jgi:DNA-binding NtrC family response regulator
VRELQNAVEYACALSEKDQITPDDLPENLVGGTDGVPEKSHTHSGPEMPLAHARAIWLEEFEKNYLNNLVRAYGDNVSAAARVAGVDRKTMRRLLTKYGFRSQ